MRSLANAHHSYLSAALTLILAMHTTGCGEREEETKVSGFGPGGIRLAYAASLVGSNVCADCHADQAEQHESHRMALTGKLVTSQNQHLWFSGEELARPTDWSTTAMNRAPRYQKTDHGLFLVHPDDDSRRIEAEAVFGSGAHGFTPIGIEDGRTVVELSLSFLAHPGVWVVTPGQEMGPDPLGRTLSAEDGERCLECHMTSVVWRGDELDTERSVPGVQCERCHGPGSAHLQAVTSGHEDSHIFNPGNLSPKEQAEFCGQCHRRSSDLDPKEILNENPSNSRHAGAGLMLSACYRQSPPETTITCTDCHNPHENIADGPASFSDSCLRCHSTLTVEHADPAIDATTDCVDCHMQRVASLGDIVFTNHWIRVPEQPRTLPDRFRQEYMSHMDSVYRAALLDTNLGPLARADLLARVAQAANTLGNREFAIASYEEALSLGPRYETRVAIANDYTRMGEGPDAAPILEGATDLEPRLRVAYQKLVRLYVDRGDPGRVEQVIQRWSENAPGDWLPGVTLMSLGRLAPAEAEFERILQNDPASAPAYLHLGNVRVLQGQIREAIGYYRQALEIAPGYLEARVELGQSLAQTGSENEAISQLRRALEIQPRSAPAHTELGLVFARQGDFDRASYHLLQALAIDPGIGKAHWGLGTVHESEGREFDAIQQYREAMALGPTAAIAGRLAWILAASSDVSLRDGDEAVTLAKSVVKLTEGTDPVIMHTLAAAYTEAGDLRSADTVSRRGLGLLEGDTSVGAGRLRDRLKLYLQEQSR